MRKSLVMLALLFSSLMSLPVYSAFFTGYLAYQEKDYNLAFAEFKPVAEQGDAEAQESLGFMYANGEGVAKDNIEAYKWFKIASLHGRRPSKEYEIKTASLMTPEQIERSMQLVRQWMQEYCSYRERQSSYRKRASQR